MMNDPHHFVAALIEEALSKEDTDDCISLDCAEISSMDTQKIDWDLVRKCVKEPETDIGNARRFLHRYGDKVVEIGGLGWAVHDGLRWVPDVFNRIVRPLVQHTIEEISWESKILDHFTAETAQIEMGCEAASRLEGLNPRNPQSISSTDHAEIARLNELLKKAGDAQEKIENWRIKRLKFAKSSATTVKIDNILKEAAPFCHKLVSLFDADPLALNVENGTIRLFNQNGLWDFRLDPHSRSDYITKLAPVALQPDEEAPLFLDFLEKILPDDDVRSFLQRYLGYCLTALTQEQVFVFFYGSGRNGKSTLVDLICKILGDYATTIPFETLAGDDRRKGSEATPDLVRIPGARIVRASEPESGMKFRESMVKSLTSSEPILIRKMREEFVEIYPNFKLILSGNHRPDIRGGDDGIWRRVILVPFEVQIPEKEIDRRLPEKLWQERSGILNWLIAGALSYLQEGLRVPKAVRAATEDYREQSDPFGAFVKAACEITRRDTDREVPGDLYTAFKIFCEKQGFYVPSVTIFNKAMPEQARKHGFVKAKLSDGRSVYRGLCVRGEFKRNDFSYSSENENVS